MGFTYKLSCQMFQNNKFIQTEDSNSKKIQKAIYRDKEKNEFTDITVNWFESTGSKKHIFQQ